MERWGEREREIGRERDRERERRRPQQITIRVLVRSTPLLMYISSCVRELEDPEE